MSILNISNAFVNGTTIQAAPFNQNFSQVQTAVNSIDNTNIGTAGIYPSQLLPTTTGQGTFGSGAAYTFPTSVTFAGPNAGPISIGPINVGTLSYTDTNILASFQSSANSYNQIVVQNTSTGSVASANFVAENNLGAAGSYYVNLGINGSGYATGVGSLNQANYGILFTSNTDLAIGTQGANGIHFVVNGNSYDSLFINGSTSAAYFASAVSATQLLSTGQVLVDNVSPGTGYSSGIHGGTSGGAFTSQSHAGAAVYGSMQFDAYNQTTAAGLPTLQVTRNNGSTYLFRVFDNGNITAAGGAAFSGTISATNSIAVGGTTLPTGGAGGPQQGAMAWNYSGGQGETSFFTTYNPGGTSFEFWRWNGSSYANVAKIDNAGDYSNANGAYLTPVYSSYGASLGFSSKTVVGSGNTGTITLTGNAVFTSSSSYSVTANVQASSGSTAFTLAVNITSGSSFTITPATGGPYVCNWIATGY